MKTFARSIVDTVRHPLVILDGELAIVVANTAFATTFGLDQVATPHRPFLTLPSRGWDESRLGPLLEDLFQTGRSFSEFDVLCKSEDGASNEYVISGRLIHRDDSEAPLILLVFEPATSRHRASRELGRRNEILEERITAGDLELDAANRELRSLNRELVAANRELEAFCYSVSHDLRTPLRALDGFSEQLLQVYSDKLDEKGQHYLRRVRAATQRMGQLIDDLLTLSRASRCDMTFERVDLSAVAYRLIADLGRQHPERSVSFSAEPQLTAWGDRRLLEIALENLLENAWKFTGRSNAAKIHFGCHTGTEGAVFYISDNGAGYDPQFADKLFGAFQRLHTEREFPGTGIGLATVQRIIRRHGGDVWAEGQVGSGATFYFKIPECEGGSSA